MNAEPKRIGLFGGTFDPVHKGHVAIAQSFLQSGKIDELWVLLNPSPPHKLDEKFAPFSIRFKMLKEAFKPFEKVIVSDLENRLPAPTYTLQTVSYLNEEYPGYMFYLCLGKDSYLSFSSWHKWKSIIEKCSLLVADRPLDKANATANEIISSHTQFVAHEVVDVSSTKVRNTIARKESISHLVPESVAAIINEQQLYR